MTSKFTCITCRVAFKDADIQRQHYKADWHRYNLKRKVADLPPVTVEEFQRRVLLQREQDNLESTPINAHCKICRKSFSSQNAFENHLNSKKHKEANISLVELEESNNTPNNLNENIYRDKIINVSADITKKQGDNPTVDDVVMQEDSDSDIEEVDSDEWDEEYKDNPIANNNCLFCSHHSRNTVKNLKHMSLEHSFFIPDVEYLVDLKGLLMYLGEKVTQGYMCLWCSEKGRSFHSSDSTKQHMVDKGHCKMLHEGETLAEYADFYDYSSSYPPDHQDNPDAEVTVPVLDDSDYQLVLPSGATIGHRSLMIYYRQNLDPKRAVSPQKKIHRLLAQYKALGWTETQREAVVRKARDIHYMKRVQSKYFTQLGVKANKFQKHFRPQVNF
uniref:C2H2-type domain-containing protein n=1 Tax=Timema genevievae TaxID=629358 RepID=A0A7R9K933_TIMGE|nr:unnamed protein product [Timema genevievae]